MNLLQTLRYLRGLSPDLGGLAYGRFLVEPKERGMQGKCVSAGALAYLSSGDAAFSTALVFTGVGS